MLSDAVDLLRCIHCAGALTAEQGLLRCAQGHSFDVARQGYVSLLAGDAQTGTADTAEMVQARAGFLARGHYAPIADAVGEAVERLAPREGCVVDLGAGTGYYLAHALERSGAEIGLALDISKHASRRAARSHPRVAAIACDAWSRLPIADVTARAAISVFSPRNPAEIARVMRRDGVLVVAAPTGRHLGELIGPLSLLDVDERKQERLAQKLQSRFERVEEREVEYAVALSRAAVSELVGMGPSAYHLDSEALRSAIDDLPEPFGVTVSVVIAAFRRAP